MEKLDLKKSKSELFKGKDGEVREVYCNVSYYLTFEGKGNPNTCETYKGGVEALYKMAYYLKFEGKKKERDFVVMPLSTLWWSETKENFVEDHKENWCWTIMVEIPEFIGEDEVELAKVALSEKGDNKYIDHVFLHSYNEGTSMQILHIGAYEDELDNISKLHNEIKSKGYKCSGKHHEIYLNDPRKVEKSKLKTIIRQPIVKEDEELDFDEEIAKFFEKLGKSKTMVLSTSSNNRVSSRNMSFVINQGKLYFQTDLNFQKSKDIDENKNVALCVDNIQIEGCISNINKLYDKESVSFKEAFNIYHKGSYEAYSRLIDNRVFEITPTLIKLYCYEGKDVVRKYIDLQEKRAYKIHYMKY